MSIRRCVAKLGRRVLKPRKTFNSQPARPYGEQPHHRFASRNALTDPLTIVAVRENDSALYIFEQNPLRRQPNS